MLPALLVGQYKKQIMIGLVILAFVIVCIVLLSIYAEHLHPYWNRTNIGIAESIKLLEGPWKSTNGSGNLYTFESAVVPLSQAGKLVVGGGLSEVPATTLLEKTMDYVILNKKYRPDGTSSEIIPLDNILRDLLKISDPKKTTINARELGNLGAPINFVIKSPNGNIRKVRYYFEIAFKNDKGGLNIRLTRDNGVMYNMVMTPATSTSPQKLSLVDYDNCPDDSPDCLVPVAVRA